MPRFRVITEGVANGDALVSAGSCDPRAALPTFAFDGDVMLKHAVHQLDRLGGSRQERVDGHWVLRPQLAMAPAYFGPARWSTAGDGRL